MGKIIIFFVWFGLLSGTVVAGISEGESPLGVPKATTLNAQRAKALFDQGVMFVDVRTEKDWEAGRIPGAEHMELFSALSESALIAFVEKSDPVVFYCNGSKCLRSSQAAQKAVEWGFQQVYYFRDGFPAWQAAGFPVE